MRNFENYTDAMTREFMVATLTCGGELYQYEHGRERHEPDGAKTVLKRQLGFFQGDWIGLIDFDLMMGRWSTKVFYCPDIECGTETVVEEAENTEEMARWMKSSQTGEPIIIEDVEAIRESNPEEYALYKRFNAVSVLAVPYRNCSSGFMVVRNPKRFKDCYEALNIMSYIATNEYIACRHRAKLLRRTASDFQLKVNQVKLNLFGEIQIQGSYYLINAEDISSDTMCSLIALLALNRDKSFNATMINAKLGMDKTPGAWKSLIYKFRKVWKEATYRDEEDYQFIISTSKGYALNPDLDIIVDVEEADKIMRTIDETSLGTAKEEMLKRFRDFYRGEFLAQDSEGSFFVRDYRALYNKKYFEKVTELIGILFSQGEYAEAEDCATEVLLAYPESVE
ncbi:MAG: hypothetical protein HUJ70_00930, partial [Pseudobutyrivibrio sp.]|nr:hypothetical protein [Pseudobutyrivibrio sp.]